MMFIQLCNFVYDYVDAIIWKLSHVPIQTHFSHKIVFKRITDKQIVLKFNTNSFFNSCK